MKIENKADPSKDFVIWILGRQHLQKLAKLVSKISFPFRSSNYWAHSFSGSIILCHFIWYSYLIFIHYSIGSITEEKTRNVSIFKEKSCQPHVLGSATYQSKPRDLRQWRRGIYLQVLCLNTDSAPCSSGWDDAIPNYPGDCKVLAIKEI